MPLVELQRQDAEMILRILLNIRINMTAQEAAVHLNLIDRLDKALKQYNTGENSAKPKRGRPRKVPQDVAPEA